ncbi:MAG TPA: protein kinase [Labilithrix sp.]
MAVPFGKYDLIAVLGRGGMADVYLAAIRGPASFRKLVVVKRLREDVAERVAFSAMLLDEAQLAARLQHPNVVQTLEVGVHEGQHYIAMEYLDGQPIGRILKVAGAPPAPFTARVMADALAGLAYAHDLTDYDGKPLSIVHRDVSPQNLFVTYSGEVKVVDFGIAKTAARVSEDTEAGVLKGKLAYMAPEQLQNKPVDRRADLWAAGVVMWEMLTGKRLFGGKSEGEAISNILFSPIARPSEIRNNVPPALEDVCMRALERDAEKRWQTASAMREAIYAFLESETQAGARRDEVGAHVASLFEKERAEVRGRITQFMAEAADEKKGLDSLRALRATNNDAETVASKRRPEADEVSTEVEAPAPAEPAGAHRPSIAPALRAHEAGRAEAHRAASFWPLAIALVVGALGVTAAIVAWSSRGAPRADVADAAASSSSAAAPAPLLVIEGSGTLGVDCMPRLVEELMKKRGATAVRREKGTQPDDVLLVAATDHGPESIVIKNEGTSGGFTCLAARTCDVAMAAREIRDSEADDLAAKGLGDLRSPASEHVVALDGIAVVVSPANPIHALERSQIADAFDAAATDWSALGGAPGTIDIYAHEAGSGTFDFFDAVVLGGHALAPNAKRMPDNATIADAAASDPNAIGFVGMAFVRGARALAVGDKGIAPTLPSAFTVTTERYLLTRRLFLYTPLPPKPLALELVEHAMSDAAQKAIRDSGFIDLTVELKSVEPCERCPARYLTATKRARRVSLDFRFRPDARRLDARAVRDVDRVVRFLRDHPTSRILLFGFVDATADAKADTKRARELAQIVDGELASRGLRASVVEGFGGEMPLASNATEWGKTKNRRVELWLADR